MAQADTREHAPKHRIDDETVTEIYEADCSVRGSTMALAERLGLGPVTVACIWCRRTYRSVTEGLVRGASSNRPQTRKRRDPRETLWGRADTRDPTACWIWVSVRGIAGPPGKYGTMAYGGYGNALVHRVAYELHYGVTLTGEDVICHHCDVPRCVNPHHLFLGDAQANRLDCVAKGRQVSVRGPRGPHLSQHEVVDIYTANTAYAGGIQDLANAYNRGAGCIHMIRCGDRYTQWTSGLTRGPSYGGR